MSFHGHSYPSIMIICIQPQSWGVSGRGCGNDMSGFFIFIWSNWDGAPPGVGALRKLRTLRIGSGGTDCIISGSDVGSKWRSLCSLLHPTTEHLNRLGAILVYTCSGIETMADWWQFTQGGSKVKHQCQSTITGGACAELCHSSKNLWTAWSVKVLIICGDLKKSTDGFLSLYGGCVHTLPTHI